MAGPGDPVLASTATEHVRELIGSGVLVNAAGEHAPLHPDDVAVITPHVEQASAIAARLADLPGILVGTANQTQGLEREAVVVIHPLAGYREARAFGTDLGRLCVALSRHRGHATVIVDADTDIVLAHAQRGAPRDASLATQRRVLAEPARINLQDRN
jgi:superfamily I DNA and/or RNA helicase